MQQQKHGSYDLRGFEATQEHSENNPIIELFLHLKIINNHILSEDAVARITPEFWPSTSPEAEQVRVDKGLHAIPQIRSEWAFHE